MLIRVTFARSVMREEQEEQGVRERGARRHEKEGEKEREREQHAEW